MVERKRVGIVKGRPEKPLGAASDAIASIAATDMHAPGAGRY